MRRMLRRAAIGCGALLVLAASPLPAPLVLDRGTPVPTAPVWRAASASRPTVYLTFDAGNTTAENVGPLLDLLAAEEVSATFFITGRFALLHPGATRRIADGGFQLANHGFNHFHAEMLPAPVQLAELWWAEQAVGLVCGQTPARLYRPPHGGTDDRTESFLASRGFRTIMWTKNPNDWREDGSVTQEGILAAIEPLEDGDIVVFHLRNAATIEALAVLIPELRDAGFAFGVLDAEALLAPAG
ncbi:MAG: polysaccharide deacetylase family protein [Actinobacteria bacterium]|nr:polysaccharide deacetylase family protein [Actinomycetota bacterium]